MGLSKRLSGRQVCEKLSIPLLKLAELCHAGRLAAYRFGDWHQILASSQCNTKFKYFGNTIFTITPHKTTGIIAISKKATEYFSVYVDKKLTYSGKQESNTRHKNKFMEAILKASIENTTQRLQNIREMQIKFCDSEYIIYYNNLTVNPLSRPAGIGSEVVRLYGNGQVFFEVKEEEGEIYLEYLELNGHGNGCIKNCVTALCIEKEQDSFGNNKFVLSRYDSNVIQVEKIDPFINRTCKQVVDEYKLKRRDSYLRDYEYHRVYLHQCAIDYFNKEDLSYSKPLSHEMDFFIFDFDEYKKRFHFFEDEEEIRKEFFSYLERLMFDENEICTVLEYDVAKKSISDDPKQYMLDRCKELKEIYKDNEENLKIVKAYMLAVEGLTWAEIDPEVWDHSKDKGNSETFVSRNLMGFKKIAGDNKIPFIAAKVWKGKGNNKCIDKESIVKDMLEQLATFYAGE